ncbi:hypothetical protein B296_00004314 [Ensete ventricosum]|uniref:Uncharacterized protein n=1 Tax=Ensete ventricosum TaxID=4639 RepID=A0A427AW12_ENSVE|nr:hypothetical protein B296_00004314 [Ensete ventricosum]
MISSGTTVHLPFYCQHFHQRSQYDLEQCFTEPVRKSTTTTTWRRLDLMSGRVIGSCWNAANTKIHRSSSHRNAPTSVLIMNEQTSGGKRSSCSLCLKV